MYNSIATQEVMGPEEELGTYFGALAKCRCSIYFIAEDYVVYTF
jgi:hypothetical protein